MLIGKARFATIQLVLAIGDAAGVSHEELRDGALRENRGLKRVKKQASAQGRGSGVFDRKRCFVWTTCFPRLTPGLWDGLVAFEERGHADRRPASRSAKEG